MQILVTIAVFGLVPVPPMPNMVDDRPDELQATSKVFDVSQLLILPGPFSKRMATQDELARIRYELEQIAAMQAA
jgi:hypothetical protein